MKPETPDRKTQDEQWGERIKISGGDERKKKLRGEDKHRKKLGEQTSEAG